MRRELYLIVLQVIKSVLLHIRSLPATDHQHPHFTILAFTLCLSMTCDLWCSYIAFNKLVFSIKVAVNHRRYFNSFPSICKHKNVGTFFWMSFYERIILLIIDYSFRDYMTHISGIANDINILGSRQNGRYFADGIFKCIFLNENIWISIEISLKFVPKSPINNIPALVQIMVRHRPVDKPLSEPVMVSLLTHICVTRH